MGNVWTSMVPRSSGVSFVFGLLLAAAQLGEHGEAFVGVGDHVC